MKENLEDGIFLEEKEPIRNDGKRASERGRSIKSYTLPLIIRDEDFEIQFF